MGYLEAPLSLNPAEREPKTTIVTRVMLGTVLTAGEGFGHPMMAPPGSSPDRVKILREAYLKALKDPKLVAEAQKDNGSTNRCPVKNRRAWRIKLWCSPLKS